MEGCDQCFWQRVREHCEKERWRNIDNNVTRNLHFYASGWPCGANLLPDFFRKKIKTKQNKNPVDATWPAANSFFPPWISGERVATWSQAGFFSSSCFSPGFLASEKRRKNSGVEIQFRSRRLLTLLASACHRRSSVWQQSGKFRIDDKRFR